MKTNHETGTADRSFARQLRALKWQGCNLLLASDVESERDVCRRSLGHPEEARRHLFVPTTTTVRSVLSAHGGSRDPTTLGVVDATAATPTRTVATAQGPGDVDPAAEWYDAVDGLRPGEIGPAVMAQLDRLASPTPEPGELRVCVESLDPFLDAVAGEPLFALLHILTARVRELRGIGHFHVAGGASMAPLEPYRPLFDATVRVETTADGRRERWLLHESGDDTGWITREPETL